MLDALARILYVVVPITCRQLGAIIQFDPTCKAVEQIYMLKDNKE